MLARRPSTPDRRRGVAAVEALFIIPLLTLVFLGGVGIADLMITEQVIDDAAAKAARAAAMGGSEERVRQAVRAALGDCRAQHAEITIRVLGPCHGDGDGKGGKGRKNRKDEKGERDEEDGKGDGDREDREEGDEGRSSNGGAAAPGQLIEVRVSIPARHALATRLAPLKCDALIVGRAVIQRE